MTAYGIRVGHNIRDHARHIGYLSELSGSIIAYLYCKLSKMENLPLHLLFPACALQMKSRRQTARTTTTKSCNHTLAITSFANRGFIGATHMTTISLYNSLTDSLWMFKNSLVALIWIRLMHDTDSFYAEEIHGTEIRLPNALQRFFFFKRINATIKCALLLH